jgi:hypothetical protein
MKRRSWSMVGRPRLIRFGLIVRILGLTLISDISNISRVFISNLVGDNLGSTIRKIYTIFAISSITITVFMLLKVGTRVVIKDSISIFIVSRGIICRFMVRIGMVGRPISRCRGMVDRSRLVDGSRGMVVTLLMGREVL